MTSPPRVVGLFAGVGGLEVGLHEAGFQTTLMVENWGPAVAVLETRFRAVPVLGDVRAVTSLPRAEVLTAGFPCTDLSQAGRTAGIGGSSSGLVHEVFRLLPQVNPTWLVLENVRNMLALDGGRAMSVLVDELESRGYRWAYRLIDSRSFGVPQRRQRVILVASLEEDPAGVLFADEAGDRPAEHFRTDAFGFYWTEGLRGLGWAQDAVPTLKGGSTVGIPSPPGIWVRDAPAGRALVVPGIGDAEVMQGFPRGWTACDDSGDRRATGQRWKMVGNAVTTGLSRWLGHRLAQPGEPVVGSVVLSKGSKWPPAAWGDSSQRQRAEASMWPVHWPYQHLLEVVDPMTAQPLSTRAAAGFLSRLEKGRLRIDPDFMVAVKEHAAVLV